MSTVYERVSHQQMHDYYVTVCKAMSCAQYYPGVIVALSRGGLDFGVKLSHWYEDAQFVPLVWQTRDGTIQDGETLLELINSNAGRSVLIVDDICDSGFTLKGIEQYLSEHGAGDQVDYAVAIHNADNEFEPTWWGRTIYRNQDPQWFLFPWENWYHTGDTP